MRERHEIDEAHRWNLRDIFDDWDQWRSALGELERLIDRYAALQGTLAGGSDALLAAFRLSDEIGQLSFKVWYFASLTYDQDQRDNGLNAKRQEVQICLRKSGAGSAWFNPELLTIPLETVQRWMAASTPLAVYRFAIEDLYRQQEHVLDEKGEHLLSLCSRFDSAPGDAYAALSTADVKHPTLTLSTGRAGHADLRARTGRFWRRTGIRPIARAAFDAFHDLYSANANTYASHLQRCAPARLVPRAGARLSVHARRRRSTATTFPTSVVANLIETTKAGVEPLRRYHRLRKRALGPRTPTTSTTGSCPLVDFDRDLSRTRTCSTGWWSRWRRLAPRTSSGCGRRSRNRWIDVYENAGKRSGAYSAPVYGVHPYMLLNYNETLDAVFTLAHEMGHSMHTLLSHASAAVRLLAATRFSWPKSRRR